MKILLKSVKIFQGWLCFCGTKHCFNIISLKLWPSVTLTSGSFNQFSEGNQQLKILKLQVRWCSVVFVIKKLTWPSNLLLGWLTQLPSTNVPLLGQLTKISFWFVWVGFNTSTPVYQLSNYSQSIKHKANTMQA